MSKRPVRTFWLFLVGGIAAGYALSSCAVDLPDTKLYSCVTAEDCGVGYQCLPGPKGVGFCCRPKEEVCDAIDNDCNGKVDDVGPSPCFTGLPGQANVGECRYGTRSCKDGKDLCKDEIPSETEKCNGKDDDCDGTVDNGIVLSTDDSNCGACGNKCDAGTSCKASSCLPGGELICWNGVDEDQDTAIDCADSDCNNKSCDAGCLCQNGAKVEASCGDGVDNDQNALIDCNDPGCNLQPCDAGCICNGTVKKETNCRDIFDNDGDTKSDCADIADCFGQLCKAALNNTFTCSDAGTCTCGALGTNPSEALCADGLDNDCDGQVDCADVNCNNQNCGVGTTCKCLGLLKTEQNCQNGNDDDSDLRTDCMDSDCTNKTCGSGVTCRSDGGCS